MEAKYSFNGDELEKQFANNNALQSYNINGLTHNVFFIDRTYDIVKEDIINNNSKRFMKYKNQNNNGINTENIKQDIYNKLFSMEKNINKYIEYLKNNYLGEINLIDKKQILYGQIVINGYKEETIYIIISTDSIYDIAFSIDIIKYIYTLKERIYSYRIIFIENVENISKICDINNFKYTIVIQNCINNIENDTLDINISSSNYLFGNNNSSNVLLLNNNIIT